MKYYECYIAYGWSTTHNKLVPRYVGIGAPQRHLHCTPSHKSHNKLVESHKHTAQWEVRVIDTQAERSDAIEWEINHIAKYGRIDQHTGTLFNHTDGGDGAHGVDRSYMQTDEYRQAMSAAKTGVYDGKHNPMYGTHTNLGKTLGPNKAISKWHTDLWANMSDDERKRRSDQISGKNNPMFGKAPANAHPVTINGIDYKSKTFALNCLREQGMKRCDALKLINQQGE